MTPRRLTLRAATREDVLKLPGNPAFYNNALSCIELHARKNVDYGYAGDNQNALGLGNFIWAAAYANTSPRVVFAVIRGIKDARIRNLVLKSMLGIAAENESQLDSQLDDVNYELLDVAFQQTYPQLYNRTLSLLPCVADTGELAVNFGATP